MKKNDLLSLLAPIALILLGVLLFFVPDTGSILLSKILGWGLTLIGMAFFVWAIVTRQWGKLVLWFVFASVGSALLAKPLALAAFVGRIVGCMLAYRGIRDFFQSVTSPGKLLAGAMALVGIVLMLFLPMSASRLVFSLCGLVLLLWGAAMLVQRLRERRHLPPSRDDIIDAL